MRAAAAYKEGERGAVIRRFPCGRASAVACRLGVRRRRAEEGKERGEEGKGTVAASGGAGCAARGRSDACGRLTRGRLTAWGQRAVREKRSDACGRRR